MSVPSLLSTPSADRNTDYLAAAESAVRAYCGWHIAPVVTEDLVLDGTGTRSLFVNTLRLVDVTAASIGGDVLDPLALEWSEAGFIRNPAGWPDKLRAVRLTVTHGFESVPDVAEIVREIAERAALSPGGITREATGPFSASFSSTAPGVSGGVVLMDHERKQLDRYKISRGL